MNEHINEQNIEIIDGVPINWSKFKSNSKDIFIEKSKRSYIGLCGLLHKNENTLLSEYVSSLEKVLIDFNCGHTPHWIKPSVYKQGSGCPVCAKERSVAAGIKGGIDSYSNREEVICDFEVNWSKFKIKSDLNEDNLRVVKKNYLKFLKELKSKEDTLVGDFINNKTTTTVRLRCGHERRITPGNYKKGCKCRVCEGVVAKRKREANDLTDFVICNGHKILSKYIDSKNDILIDFNCGHEPQWINPVSYRRKAVCQICDEENKYKLKIQPLIDVINRNNHKLLSEYINEHTKILIDYNCNHGSNWIVPATYKDNPVCPKCSKINNRKTRILDISKTNNHNIIYNYTDDNKNILIDFNCGHEPQWIDNETYSVRTICPKCKKNKEEEKRRCKVDKFKNLVVSKNHKLLTEYTNCTTKVLIDFNCGHEPHWINPYHYKQGKGCPKCSGQCQVENRNKIMALINKNNHKLLSEFINKRTKVLIDFNCGHEPHWITPQNYKQGKVCPKCSGKCSDQAKENFIDSINSNNYKLLSDYVNSATKVLIDFNCGHEPHWINPYHYKNGHRCPLCKNKGEGELHKLLLGMGYEVETQKKYDNLRDKKPLSYDFYLPQYNLLIELDGEHHRKVVTYKSKGMTDFEKDMAELDALIRYEDRKYKDKLKNYYAKNNNIPLLRIEYNQSKIELDKWRELIQGKIRCIENSKAAYFI